jgi:hypothetical protein
VRLSAARTPFGSVCWTIQYPSQTGLLRSLCSSLCFFRFWGFFAFGGLRSFGSFGGFLGLGDSVKAVVD